MLNTGLRPFGYRLRLAAACIPCTRGTNVSVLVFTGCLFRLPAARRSRSHSRIRRLQLSHPNSSRHVNHMLASVNLFACECEHFLSLVTFPCFGSHLHASIWNVHPEMWTRANKCEPLYLCYQMWTVGYEMWTSCTMKCEPTLANVNHYAYATKCESWTMKCEPVVLWNVNPF